MKQIDECLSRAFEGRRPLKKKWRAGIDEGKLYLFHYHHLVMIYDLKTKEIKHEWWEKPTDKRGLDAAKKWLKENRTEDIN